jgi:hypothetical protein
MKRQVSVTCRMWALGILLTEQQNVLRWLSNHPSTYMCTSVAPNLGICSHSQKTLSWDHECSWVHTTIRTELRAQGYYKPILTIRSPTTLSKSYLWNKGLDQFILISLPSGNSGVPSHRTLLDLTEMSKQMVIPSVPWRVAVGYQRSHFGHLSTIDKTGKC